jgi:hypothetical protein
METLISICFCFFLLSVAYAFITVGNKQKRMRNCSCDCMTHDKKQYKEATPSTHVPIGKVGLNTTEVKSHNIKSDVVTPTKKGK